MHFRKIADQLGDQVAVLAMAKTADDSVGDPPSEALKLDAREEYRNIDVFQAIVARYPNKTALTSLRGSLDYSTLNIRANRLAWHLRSWGVSRGTIVGVRLPRSIDYILCMIAIWKAGGAYLPIDCSVPDERVKLVLEDCQAEYLLTSQAISTSHPCEHIPKNAFYIDLDESSKILSKCSSANLPVTSEPEDLAYIIYTSGSTGRPKGVTITHDSMLNMANEHRQSGEIEENDRVMVFSPCCFDASIRDINGSLLTGATLYVPDENEILPGNLINVLQRQCISYVVVTPSVLRNCHLVELPHLRKLAVAGEAADAQLIKQWGAGRTLINAYGPTETSVCATKRVYQRNEEIDDSDLVSIGYPTLNTKIYILDDSLNPVESGEVGEIYIGGPGVSRQGYLNRPDLNERAFLPDPFQPGRMFKSGDLGKLLPNGGIHCLGRGDSQVKLNGLRIEVEDIESWLRSDERIEAAAVDLRGPSDRRFLAAWVIRNETGKKWSDKELIADLKALLHDQIPNYSVPSTISFVDEWPKNAASKIVKSELPDPMAETNTEATEEVDDIECPTEIKLVEILREVLRIPEDRVITSSKTYNELGGTSIRAQLFLNRIKKEFGCTISIGSFYTCGQSIRAVATLIKAEDDPFADSLERDFTEKVSLPHDILPLRDTPYHQKPRKAKNILLTGATGFLGAHILAELLKLKDQTVTCVVRAEDSVNAERRIRSCLVDWGLWQEAFADRLHGVPGDISAPFLGLDIWDFERLARECNTIWHCAANVNFVAPYEISEPVNVNGTVEVLRFASTFTPKEVKYVSTLAAFFGVRDQIDYALEDSTATYSHGIATGYAQSKWVAEQIALGYRDRGGDIVILRPGRVLGSLSQKKSPKQDLSICMFRSFIETQMAPELDWSIDFTPVDICAKLCLDIATSNQGGIYHIINPESLKLAKLVASMNELGYAVRSIPYSDWKDSLSQSQELEPLISLFQDPVDKAGNSQFETLLNNLCFRHSAYSTSLAQQAVSEKSLWEFPSYQDLLKAYLEDNA